MKSFASLILLAFTFVSSTFAVTTEKQVRILLNNGVVAPGMSCTDADWRFILQVFYYTRRNLRQGSNKLIEHSFDDSENTGNGRKLPSTFYPASCRTACDGQARGHCVAAGCRNYRREMEGETETGQEAMAEQDERGLQDSNEQWCTSAKRTANLFLTSVASGNALSQPCRNLVNAPRTIDCLLITC